MSAMKDSIYQYSLLEITLPGTHDSGTYQLYDEVGPDQPADLADIIKIGALLNISTYEFIRKWSQTQNTTFYQQLSAGIRYLDIRSVWYKSDWRTEHFLVGVPTQTLLNDIRDFVAGHPGEVIVLEIGNLAGRTPANEPMLARMINDTLGKWLVTPKVAQLNTNIGQLVSMDRRIFAFYSYASFTQGYDFLWNDNYIEGSYANEDSLDKMIAWNVDEIKQQGGRGRLFELSWTLTVQTADILRALLGLYKYDDLKSMALLADGALASFAKQYSNYKLGNLLLVDWSNYTPVVEIAITNNARMCNDDPVYRSAQTNGQYCRAYAANGYCLPGSANYSFAKSHCMLSCGFC